MNANTTQTHQIPPQAAPVDACATPAELAAETTASVLERHHGVEGAAAHRALVDAYLAGRSAERNDQVLAASRARLEQERKKRGAAAGVRIAITADPFYRSHGHHPRGRGSWIFSTSTAVQGSWLDGNGTRMVTAPGNMTYGEACSWLKAQIRAEVARRVEMSGAGPAVVRCEAQP
jgi:hypothetical protein